MNYDVNCPAIDYLNSEFIDELEEIPVRLNSFQDWVALNMKPPAPPLIAPTRLILHTPMDFLLIPFRNLVIISERLKRAIEALPLSGFEFETIEMEVLQA